MADVFISYSREDRALVAPIAGALGALGVDVWFDARLEPGGAFSEEIQRQLHACKAQLVCWSPAATASQWVLGEADVGRQRGVLIPVQIAQAAAPPPFNMMHAEDLSGFDGRPSVQAHAGWRKVLATLGARLGRHGLADLWPLLADATAAQWKAWAEANADDAMRDEAWARYEALHLDAEKNRLAEERERAREAAAREAERRAAEAARAAAEAERLARMRQAAEAEAAEARRNAAAAASLPNEKRERSPRFLVFFAGALGLAAVGALATLLVLREQAPAAHATAPAPQPPMAITPAGALAAQWQGAWRSERDDDCEAPLAIAFQSDGGGEWLILRTRLHQLVAGVEMAADAERRDRVLGLEDDTLQVFAADAFEGAYREREGVLEISVAGGTPTRWLRCADAG